MAHKDLQILTTIDSYEKFEKIKSDSKLWDAVVRDVISRHGISPTKLQVFTEGTNIVYALDASHVIKLFPPCHRDQFNSEIVVLKHLQGKLSVNTPVVFFEGDIFGWPYLIMSQLPGTLLETLWSDMNFENKQIIMRELGQLIREVHQIPIDGLEHIDCRWSVFIDHQIRNCVAQHTATHLPSHLLTQIAGYIASIQDELRVITKPVILTGEYTPMNFLVKRIDCIWHIDGLIDFGDAMLGLPEYDLLGPGAFLIQGDKALLKTFLAGYGYSAQQMNSALSHKLTALMLLHKYSNLEVQARIPHWKEKAKSMKDLENLVWGFEPAIG